MLGLCLLPGASAPSFVEQQMSWQALADLERAMSERADDIAAGFGATGLLALLRLPTPLQ